MRSHHRFDITLPGLARSVACHRDPAEHIDAPHAQLSDRDAEFYKPGLDMAWGRRESGAQAVDGHRPMLGQPSAS